MGDVYKNASAVHIWLGAPSTGSDAAMQFMRTSFAYYYKEEALSVPALSQTQKLSRRSQISKLRDELSVPLDDLYKRPYWSRLWCDE